jgi:replicative DNA helicase
MGRNDHKNAVQLKDEQVSQVRALLANLAYVEVTPELATKGLTNPPINRLAEMGQFRITPALLKECGLETEATVLKVIENIIALGKAPTFEAIQGILGNEWGEKRAEAVMDTIRSHRTIDRDVGSLAFSLVDYMRTRELAAALYDLADNDVLGPYDSFPQKFERVMKRISDLAPISMKSTACTYDELWEMTEEYATEAVERRRTGRSTGPKFPWEQLNMLVRGGMKPGDMWLVTAKSKHGKTTFATEIGRHIAFNQKDYLVLMLHLETSQLTLGQREAAREFVIKPGTIREGLIDPRDEKWAKKFKKAQDRVAWHCGVGEKSKYWYEHCPGLTLNELEYFLRRYKTRAEAMGLELVVILDYYQEMDWYGLAETETAGLNILATKLKTLFDQYEVYAIVFAQESLDEDERNRTTPYMARKIVMRAQGHIRILRGHEDGHEFAEEDLPVYDAVCGDDGQLHTARDENGLAIVKKDGLGEKMYWHRQGQPDSYIRLHLVRANDDEPGMCYLQMANGYFKIQEVNQTGR